MTLSRRDILEELRTHKKELRRFGVEEIGLFGSYVSDEQSEESDIDFLVEFNEVNFDNYMDLKFFLEDRFHKKVDLVIKRDLKPALEHVKEEAEYVTSA